jgi:O-antigen ligase
MAAVVLSPSFRDVDYKSYAVSIGFLLLLLVEAFRLFKKPELSFSPLELYLVLYVGWTCLSYFWSPIDLAASEYLGRFLPCVGVFLLVRQGSKETEGFSRMSVWMGLAFLVTLYGLLQKAGVDFIPVYAQNGSSTRIFTTFGNPNLYASFLVLTMPVTLLSALNRKGGVFETVFQAILLILFLINLLFTLSRAGLVGFTVEFILIVFLLGERTWRDPRWRLGLVLVTALVLLSVGFVAYKVGARPTERIEVWKGAVRMMLDRPFEGWGVGQFSLHFQPYMTEELSAQGLKDNTFAEHAHNEVLELGVELGLVGLVVAGLFWLRLMGRAVRQVLGDRKDGQELGTETIGLAAGLLGLGITNLFDYNCRLPGIAFFLWMSAGLLANRVFPPDKIKLNAQLGVLIGLLIIGGTVFGLVQETRLLTAVWMENPERDFLKEIPPDLSIEQQRILESIKNQPANPDHYHELGNLFVKSGKMDDAQKAFEKELQLNPQSAGAYLNLGNIYLLTSESDPRRIELAGDCYKKSIQLDPNKVEGHFDLAYVYFLHRDLKSALRELDAVLKIDPQNAKALSLKRQILP